MMQHVGPFVGPRSFVPSDSELFFGRYQVLQKLVDRVRNQPIVILFGTPGSGKTSLIRAGLLPSMAASEKPPNLALLMQVQDDPFLGLACSLIDANRSSRSNESHVVAHSLAASMKSGLAECSALLCQEGYPLERTLLTVDQYEEAFVRLSLEHRKQFESTLAGLANEFGLRILLAVRSEYLGPAISDGPLSELGPCSLVPLNPLTIDEAREIITKPAMREGVQIEAQVVDKIISDLRGELEPYLLQLIMQQLWSYATARFSDRITLTDYVALGGVSQLTSRVYQEPEARSRWTLSRLARSVGLTALSQTLEERIRLLEEAQADLERVDGELNTVVLRRNVLRASLQESLNDKHTNAPRVFVGYAREDDQRATELYTKLKGMGFRPWIDSEDMPPGKEWALEIQKAMHESDFVIICLSNNSVSERGFVQRELQTAVALYEEVPEGRMFLLPVRFDECPMPGQLSKFRYTNLFEDRGLDKLARAILEEWARQVKADDAEGA